MQQQIENLIIESLSEFAEELKNVSLDRPTKDTKIYGIDGVLDSFALVSLIVDLEERISDEFDKDITLASERAISQKNSPFRSVKHLTDYIKKILE